jgi:hypothetical protein
MIEQIQTDGFVDLAEDGIFAQGGQDVVERLNGIQFSAGLVEGFGLAQGGLGGLEEAGIFDNDAHLLADGVHQIQAAGGYDAPVFVEGADGTQAHAFRFERRTQVSLKAD